MPDLGLDVLLKGTNALRLLDGLGAAVKISMISVLLSIPLGVLLGVLMQSQNVVIRALTRAYLEVFRFMPQLVLLFIVFFGMTGSFGINLSGELSSIIVFCMWGTAEMGDLVRSAMSGIPKIQYESGAALGLSKGQIYFHIVIPQAIRQLIPLSINLITRMIKTTSLVLMIGVIEVMKVAQQIIEANRMTSPNAAFGLYLVIFLMYFAVCFPISQFGRYLDHKLN